LFEEGVSQWLSTVLTNNFNFLVIEVRLLGGRNFLGHNGVSCSITIDLFHAEYKLTKLCSPFRCNSNVNVCLFNCQFQDTSVGIVVFLLRGSLLLGLLFLCDFRDNLFYYLFFGFLFCFSGVGFLLGLFLL
jgi:hypothetical protein